MCPVAFAGRSHPRRFGCLLPAAAHPSRLSSYGVSMLLVSSSMVRLHHLLASQVLTRIIPLRPCTPGSCFLHATCNTLWHRLRISVTAVACGAAWRLAVHTLNACGILGCVCTGNFAQATGRHGERQVWMHEEAHRRKQSSMGQDRAGTGGAQRCAGQERAVPSKDRASSGSCGQVSAGKG